MFFHFLGILEIVDHPRINIALLGKAINAMIRHHRNVEQKEGIELIKFVTLVITLNKIPEQIPSFPYFVHVPYSLFSENARFFFISKEPSEKFQKLFEEKMITSIVDVVSFNTFKKENKSFDNKRMFFNNCDGVLCDAGVKESLRKNLGKKFSFNKYVIPIQMVKKRLHENIINARDDIVFYLEPEEKLTIKIAKTNMTHLQIKQNILESIDYIISKIPRKWKNIHSLGIKSPKSIELPFYEPTLTPESTETN